MKPKPCTKAETLACCAPVDYGPEDWAVFTLSKLTGVSLAARCSGNDCMLALGSTAYMGLHDSVLCQTLGNMVM